MAKKKSTKGRKKGKTPEKKEKIDEEQKVPKLILKMRPKVGSLYLKENVMR